MSALPAFAQATLVMFHTARRACPRTLDELDEAERMDIVAKRNAGTCCEDIELAHYISAGTLGGVWKWARRRAVPMRQFKRGTSTLL